MKYQAFCLNAVIEIKSQFITNRIIPEQVSDVSKLRKRELITVTSTPVLEFSICPVWEIFSFDWNHTEDVSSLSHVNGSVRHNIQLLLYSWCCAPTALACWQHPRPTLGTSVAFSGRNTWNCCVAELLYLGTSLVPEELLPNLGFWSIKISRSADRRLRDRRLGLEPNFG